MRLGIDASNLRQGGGVTHLKEVLRVAQPAEAGVREVVVWGGRATLDEIAPRPWLSLVPEAALDRGLLRRQAWQRFELHRRAVAARCDLLFVPGGAYAGPFRPFVTMSRNLLPFEEGERERYGVSAMRLKLETLRRGQAATLRRAAGVIFLTAYAQQVVTRTVPGIGGRTALIPHGVTPAFLMEPRPQVSAEALGPQRPFRLLYVSTVDMYKHQWHVAGAVDTLRRRGRWVTLDLVGGAYGPALARLMQAVAGLGPAHDAVQYLGPMAHASLARKYHEADAFVFASSCENMPNILLEAMGAGLPIACARRGPMPEVLGPDGVYFDPEDRDSIAGAIERLYGDPGLRAAVAADAFERAGAYSWQRCADATFAFLGSFGGGAAVTR